MRINQKTVLSAALLLLCMGMTLTGCEKKPKADVKLTYNAAVDGLQCGEGESLRTYLFAPVSYEPAATLTAPYAEWEENRMFLYPVEGWEPEILLSEEYTGVGGLLYADTFDLPTLTGMEPDSIYVCTATSVVQAFLEIDDADVVRRAAELLENGECVDLPQDGTTTYYLKFRSEKYAGIYYNVVYIEVGEEENAVRYLYDRSTKRCVELPYEIFDGWLYGAVEDTDGLDIADADNVQA